MDCYLNQSADNLIAITTMVPNTSRRDASRMARELQESRSFGKEDEPG